MAASHAPHPVSRVPSAALRSYAWQINEQQHSRRSLCLQFHRAPTDNDRGGYVNQWEAAGLLEPALGPFDVTTTWARRDADGAVVVTTEFTLKPNSPKPRFCRLFREVRGGEGGGSGEGSRYTGLLGKIVSPREGLVGTVRGRRCR